MMKAERQVRARAAKAGRQVRARAKAGGAASVLLLSHAAKAKKL
jgi:hypothetical protein